MSIIGVDWDFALLEELIDARGEDVIVETGIACTCRNGDLYASTLERHNALAASRRLNCVTCQGDGYIYRNARYVRGLITSIDPGRNKQLIELGIAIPGDAVFSPTLSDVHVGDLDKITFLFSQIVNEGQVIMRGASHLGENAQISTDLTVAEDRLWYSADYAIWCEDEDGVVYSQHADFELDAKKIRWVGNTQPNVGKLYTLKYSGYPEWVVYSQPFLRSEGRRNLGNRVLIRKKHVHYMTGSQADTVETRVNEEAAFTTRTKI